MIEFVGKIGELTFDFKGNAIIPLVVSDKDSAVLLKDTMQENAVRAKFEAYKPKRSIDANAYCWVLLGKLAEALNRENPKAHYTKEEVYRNYIKDVGGNVVYSCIRDEDVDFMIRGWEERGIGWLTEKMPSKLDGCTNVAFYLGSSKYDSAQMSRLIDMIIADCEELGIQTMTPNQLAELKSRWGE